MAALTDRQQARARLRAAFEAAVERIIPTDETAPLKGRTFREWEAQADAFDRTVTAVLLQERAALEDGAQVTGGGHCPFCAATDAYLRKERGPTEVQTSHGTVVLERQKARCRSCGRTFSPSGPRLGVVDGDPAAVAQGRRAAGARGGDPAL